MKFLVAKGGRADGWSAWPKYVQKTGIRGKHLKIN